MLSLHLQCHWCEMLLRCQIEPSMSILDDTCPNYGRDLFSDLSDSRLKLCSRFPSFVQFMITPVRQRVVQLLQLIWPKQMQYYMQYISLLKAKPFMWKGGMKFGDSSTRGWAEGQMGIDDGPRHVAVRSETEVWGHASPVVPVMSEWMRGGRKWVWVVRTERNERERG